MSAVRTALAWLLTALAVAALLTALAARAERRVMAFVNATAGEDER